MAVQIRRIRPGEGAQLRQVRLAALEDAPSAFESTLDEELCRPIEQWEAHAEVRARGHTSANFVAVSDHDFVGLVGAYRTGENPETVDLVSMWVKPSERGRGIGKRLIEAVVTWARDGSANSVVLWVTRTNDAAVGLYSEMGFVPTGVVKTHAWHTGLEEVRMVRPLAGVADA